MLIVHVSHPLSQPIMTTMTAHVSEPICDLLSLYQLVNIVFVYFYSSGKKDSYYIKQTIEFI